MHNITEKSAMSKFIYGMPPIDHFAGAISADEYVERLIKEPPEAYGSIKTPVIAFIEMAMQCARAVCTAEGSFWEGDIRHNNLYVFSVPVDSPEMAIGLIWKQENNGSTYVCSPIEMPALEEYRLHPNYRIRRGHDTTRCSESGSTPIAS
jgi:hypothetical protein